MKKFEASDGSVTYFRWRGNTMITTTERPEGYDTDDDVLDPAFQVDLNHRPFHEFWTSGSDGNNTNDNSQVCFTFLS